MKTLVLGIGNVLWADEGFGVRALEALDAHYLFESTSEAEIDLIDGGTQGIYLVHHVEAADNLIVFDAVDYGLQPGEIKVVKDDEVPAFLGVKKMSLHQTGFQEVLATAQLKGDYPSNITLIGVQPENIEDYGGSLTETTKAQLMPCVELAVTQIKAWGHTVSPREVPANSLMAQALNMDDYETQRPSSSEAPRIGDNRVLSDDDFVLREAPLVVDDGLTSVPVDGRKLFEDA